jgi:hypothetical protein
MDAASRLPDGVRPAILEGAPLQTPGNGRPVMFVDVMPRTPDGRIHLFPSGLETRDGLYAYEPDPATAAHPLSLISPAAPHHLIHARRASGDARLKIHPEDAQRVDRRRRSRPHLQRWVKCSAGVNHAGDSSGTVSLPKPCTQHAGATATRSSPTR